MKPVSMSIAVLLALLATPARARDVVHLKSGESTPCEIEAVTDNIITFSLLTGGGSSGGSARRTLSMDRVDYIEFGFEPGEEEVYRRRGELDVETLEKWWNEHFAHLDRPRSRTADYGVALGNALLREDPDHSAQRALALFERIAERAWSDHDRADAQRGRLNALMTLGRLDEARREAALLADRTEDPALLIEVRHLQARADFEELKALEEKHPRWEVDDEVRPEREALYHRILDRFLWPHLFHATREDAAARGLLAAGRVHEFAGETGQAIARYTDLRRLYPGAPAAEEAGRRLERLSRTDTPSESDPP